MSDDDDNGLTGHLANIARKHQAPPPQPQAGKVGVARVGRFWSAPRMAAKPGLKAVDMFRAVGEGRIKAIWIMATNPMVSLPDADFVREALKKLELFVVSENVRSNDTVN